MCVVVGGMALQLKRQLSCLVCSFVSSSCILYQTALETYRFISYFALSRGDWRELEFKEYNFNAKGQPLEGGHLHPLLKVIIRIF